MSQPKSVIQLPRQITRRIKQEAREAKVVSLQKRPELRRAA
jgi:hypothetical protein